jgi:lysine-N-methylase
VSTPPLPVRPRLADHARVRRHVVDGVEIVVLHHAVNGDLLRMGPREWDLVAGADGTRDLDALVLAAARRGALRRVSELSGVLEALHAAGLLADGLDPPALPPEPLDPERPLEALPRFSLSCDASGGCCTLYGSVAFSPLEAARARSLRPGVLGGGDRQERVFMPERGSATDGPLAVALVDGRCAYLDTDGRCSLHVLGGEAGKPRGCRVYPATFVDDGERVRVSVGVECSCVLASVGREGGAPLIPPGARTRSDLGSDARVAVLPAQIPITRAASVARSAFVSWSRLVAGLVPGEGAAGDPDVAAIFWSLAQAIDAGGLDEGATGAAVLEARRPVTGDLAPWIEALAARARARVKSADAWRSGRDRSRQVSGWIATAAEALRDPAACAVMLDPATGSPRDEAFFARATLHGHLLAGELPLATALRDRAVRLVLSRALPAAVPASDAARAHPLALVEAMMRGHGLGAYAAEVGGA